MITWIVIGLVSWFVLVFSILALFKGGHNVRESEMEFQKK